MTKKQQYLFFVAPLVIFISFAFGFLLGNSVDLYENMMSGDTVEISKVLDLYSKTRSSEVNFDQFWEVWDMVKEGHVDQPISDVDLFYGAIEGMVAGVGDPYTNYFPPSDAKAFVEVLSGEFEGIGAEIGLRDDRLTIIAPLPSSPAEQAGLRPGDVVYRIDGEDTTGITVEAAVTKIRGEKGTDVILSVSSNGFENLREVTITRDKIVVPTIIQEMKEGNIAYLRISHFNEDSSSEFDAAVDELLAQDPSAMILDLRSNPGGLLPSAIHISSEWIEDGVILRERGKNGEVTVHKSRGKHRLKDIPTVVLIDNGSASGSEIVAGALQDNEQATIIGMQSFGKGSVQHFEPLLDGSAIKLTVAKWFTPNDKQINEVGITPDIMMTAEEMYVEDESAEFGVRDAGIERAMEYLQYQ